MDELRQQMEENIASCLTAYATNADVVARQLFGRAVLQVLYQPLNRVLYDIHTIASTLLMVSEDPDASVRAHLLDQIPEIFMRCRELSCEDLDYYLYDRLLEIVLRYLKDIDPQVRRNAYYAITHLLEKFLLDKERIEEKVCPAVFELSKHPIVTHQHQIDYHTKAVELMGLLAPSIGREKTQEFFLDRFIEMCSDNIYYVRKSCADFCPVICQVMGQEVTERQLLPIFMQLCEDNEWGVRKSAAESFTKVALMCSLDHRREQLAPLLFKLMIDSSRWVSFAAFKGLGQFISSFAQPCITGLAYTSQGELFITNAADFNITHQTELLNNFVHYKKMFNESIATNQSLPIAASDESAYADASLNTNPYQKFLAPEAFANIGYIPNATPIATPTPPSPLIVPSTGEQTSNNDNSCPRYNPDKPRFLFNWSSGSQLASPTPLVVNNSSNNNNNNNSLNNFNKSNNNETVIKPYYKSNVAHCSFGFSQLNANDLIGAISSSIIANENHGTAIDPESDEGNNNSFIVAPLQNETADAISSEEIENIAPITDVSIIGNESSSTSSNTSNNGASTTTIAAPLLRKNTPHGLPSIIKQAIENNANSPRKMRKNTAMSLIMPKSTDLPPPETPSIELAPQNIDFGLNHALGECDSNEIGTDQRVEQKNLLNTAQMINCLINSNDCSGDGNTHNLDIENIEMIDKVSGTNDYNDDNDVDYDDYGISSNNDGNTNTKQNAKKNPRSTLEMKLKKMQTSANIDASLSSDVDINNDISGISSFSDNSNSSMTMNDINREFLKDSRNLNDSENDDDDTVLKQFNSVNYWYISPDIPLDLDNFVSPKAENDICNLSSNIQYSYDHHLYEFQVELNRCEPRIQSMDSYESPTIFKQDIVPAYLVQYFASMITLEDSDMNAACAYNFPAVVLTLGRENWHIMCFLLNRLCGDIQWKIRKTVAVSIYPIALIIGTELATRDLVPVFLGFFKDLDVVKVEALRNLDDFLKVVSLEHHFKIVMSLGDCLKTDNDANWRFREELAHQVLLLIKTYGLTYNVECMIYLTGIAFMLLTDKVNSVREVALEAIVAKFAISSMLEVAHLTNILIEEFAKHSHWRRRQIYTSFCHKCISSCCLNEEMIRHLATLDKEKMPNVRLVEMNYETKAFASLSEEMINSLIFLSKDKVPNVRLSVAKCLKDVLSGEGRSNLSEDQCNVFSDTLTMLQNDTDRDVRNCALDGSNLDGTNSNISNMSTNTTLSLLLSSSALNQTMSYINDTEFQTSPASDETTDTNSSDLLSAVNDEIESIIDQLKIDDDDGVDVQLNPIAPTDFPMKLFSNRSKSQGAQKQFFPNEYYDGVNADDSTESSNENLSTEISSAPENVTNSIESISTSNNNNSNNSNNNNNNSTDPQYFQCFT